MAEIQSTDTRKKKAGVSKGKKLSTRVDLTPMVDLGFLLITFFIFTTALAKPNALHLNMPMDSNDSLHIGEKDVVSLVLGKDHNIFFYKGSELEKIEKLGTHGNPLRDVLIEQKKLKGKADDGKFSLVVLIKASAGATYGDVVNVIDEMVINEVGKYIMMEPSKEELIITESL